MAPPLGNGIGEDPDALSPGMDVEGVEPSSPGDGMDMEAPTSEERREESTGVPGMGIDVDPG